MTDRETGTSGKVPHKQIPSDGNSPQVALPCSDNIEVPIAPVPKRELGQATLSTISEVSVAAEETLSRTKAPRRAFRWLAIPGFFLLAYIASSLVAIYALKSEPWVRVFLAPLAPVFLATLAFAWSRRWKSRAQALGAAGEAWRNAAGSLGHEAANGVNAIRANLIAFRLANPPAEGHDHLEEIEQACARLDAAVESSKRSSGH